DRWFTIYFAQIPLAQFDSWHRRITPLPKQGSFSMDEAGEGGKSSPSPAPHPLTEVEEKMSGMCPV
ncbi:MAG: hypothetical protein LAN83_20295, partial [Acidobacteriia bacterium]|nr:hypothetical protein [Terriglobia bacterium]MBZ5600651.1 hypothetical protein [Terriglobia bacterium]